MSSVAALLKLDRKRFADAADYLAIALVVSLPWSTSATGILTVTWLLAFLPTLDFRDLRRELSTAAGGLPVLLVAAAAVGMLWSDVAWSERATGFVSYTKLLVIPLLFVQFSRSERGHYAIYALLAACVGLLAASYMTILFQWMPSKGYGIFVKDYISQSGFFTLAAFLLVELAVDAWRERRRWHAAIFVLLSAAFLANMVYVITGRTALMVIPVLIVMFGLRRNWKAAIGAILVTVLLAGLAWFSSSYLRNRLEAGMAMQTPTRGTMEPSSNALRLAFWSASRDIVEQAPVFGHGTGSIRAKFHQYGVAHPGSMVEQATNPHNQSFAVAIQLGLVGVVLLFAMWFAHALMFRGPGLAAWFGCVAVAQNVIGSLVNSHLFDFTQGWAYVVCVGIAGGMVRANFTVAGQPKGRYERASRPTADRRTS